MTQKPNPKPLLPQHFYQILIKGARDVRALRSAVDDLDAIEKCAPAPAAAADAAFLEEIGAVGGGGGDEGGEAGEGLVSFLGGGAVVIFVGNPLSLPKTKRKKERQKKIGGKEGGLGSKSKGERLPTVRFLLVGEFWVWGKTFLGEGKDEG